MGNREIASFVTPAVYSRMLGYMVRDYTWFDRYTTQYIDVLNVEWIDMVPDKRSKTLSTIAERISEKGEAYKKLRVQVRSSAEHYKTTESSISPTVDYPEEFGW